MSEQPENIDQEQQEQVELAEDQTPQGQEIEAVVPQQNEEVNPELEEQNVDQQPEPGSQIIINDQNKSGENFNQNSFQNQSQFNNSNEENVDEYLYDIEIAKRVEKEKLQQIYQASVNLKQKLITTQGRCPVCTLVPPCKHLAERIQPQNVRTDQEVQQMVVDAIRDKQSHTHRTNTTQQDSIFTTQADKKRGSKVGTFNTHNHHSVSINNPSLDISKLEPNQGSIHNQSNWSAVNDFQTDNYGQKLQDHVQQTSPQNQHINSPNKKYQHAHHMKQSNIAGGNESVHVNELVSPYSILRTSAEQDVDYTIQKITMGVGPRSTRAQLLRQLALKKKFDENPFLAKRAKQSKDEAFLSGEDPHFNDLNMSHQSINRTIYPDGRLPHQMMKANSNFGQARMRNKRGEFVSIDAASNRGSIMPAIPTARNSSTADVGRRKVNEVRKAENRLRMIEQISKYREEKIRREFMKLDEDLRHEEERQRQAAQKEIRMKKYHDAKKNDLARYQQEKAEIEYKTMLSQREMQQKHMRDRKVSMERNEEKKAKIRMYKEYKAQQILELQMREQGIIAAGASMKMKGRQLYPIGNRNQYMVPQINQMGPMEPHVPMDHLHEGQIDDNLLQGDPNHIQEENDEDLDGNAPPEQRSEPSDHLDQSKMLLDNDQMQQEETKV